MNFSDDGYAMQVVIGLESAFYPDIDALYRSRIDAWAEEMRPE